MTVLNEDSRFAQIVDVIAPGSVLLRTWSLSGGISAAMTALELAESDGHTQRMIVRRPGAATLARDPQAARREFKLLQLTWSLGLPTPMPYHLDSSGTILPTPYLVIDYIEGNPVFDPADRLDYARQLATQLAAIHRVDCAGLDLAFLPQHPSRLVDSLGPRPLQAAPWFQEGRLRAIVEAAWPFPQRNESTLLHGDFWPGNSLWRDEKLVAVIDWEDAQLGDPLMDLAISRLDVLWIFGGEAMQIFTEQYRSVMPIDDTALSYWDLWAALRLARLAGAQVDDWAAFFHPFGRHDITEQTIQAHYQRFVTQACERLGYTEARDN